LVPSPPLPSPLSWDRQALSTTQREETKKRVKLAELTQTVIDEGGWIQIIRPLHYSRCEYSHGVFIIIEFFEGIFSGKNIIVKMYTNCDFVCRTMAHSLKINGGWCT
jgi:hypothetical protein